MTHPPQLVGRGLVPRHLRAAFRADDVLRAGLGERFSDYFATSREWELSAWRDSVSDWERARYERSV